MEAKITTLLSEQQVSYRIKELAEEINRDYEGKEVHLICILKGSVFFTTELAKHITVPLTRAIPYPSFRTCSGQRSLTRLSFAPSLTSLNAG